MNTIIGAVEIGTSQAKALVGEVTDGSNLKIVGRASAPNEGVRRGEIVDYQKVAGIVHSVIDEAERSAGATKVQQVYLALTGAHLRGISNRGPLICGHRLVYSARRKHI